MADAGATATGLKELREAIDRLPDEVTKALRAVALISASRIKSHAQQILRSKTHGTGATANAIVVIPEPEKKQYVVDSKAPSGRPNMLPTWLEFGTRYMAARPYMRPAGDAEDEHYKREAIAAASSTVDTLGKF